MPFALTSTSRSAVEKQDLRLVRQRLGDHDAAHHAAGQRDDLGVLLVPQRQILQHLLDMIGVLRLAEQAAAEADGRPHRLERVGVQFLRHQPDQGTRGAIIGVDVMAVDGDAAFAQIGDAADDADQRGLAGAVRPQQREDFAALDLEVDAVERPETGAIGFRQICNGDDGSHAGLYEIRIGNAERARAALRRAWGRGGASNHR
jgi:hypothetical protein